MGCRIGITTRPDERREEWEDIFPFLSDWRILATVQSKTAAQKKENELAKKYGCEASAGGSGPENATWYVYMFRF